MGYLFGNMMQHGFEMLPKIPRQFQSIFSLFIKKRKHIKHLSTLNIKWYGKIRVTSCELRATSYELRASKHELKFESASSIPRVMSSNLRVQIHELQVQLYELLVQIYELRVQIHEFKNHLINENSSNVPYVSPHHIKGGSSNKGCSPVPPFPPLPLPLLDMQPHQTTIFKSR